MAELFGAPLGIIAREESNRAELRSGLDAIKTLGEIQAQPVERELRSAQARLYGAQADAAATEAEAAAKLNAIQEQFLLEQGRAQGKDLSIEELAEAKGPTSQADPLIKFLEFATNAGLPPMATVKLREDIAKIKSAEAVAAYRSGQAVNEGEKFKRGQIERIGSVAATAAADPTAYAQIMLNPETRKLLPPQITGDYRTDKPILEVIARSSMTAVQQMDAGFKARQTVATEKRAAAAQTSAAASAEAAKARADLSKTRADAIRKNGGTGSPEAAQAKKDKELRAEEAAKAADLKRFPPVPADPIAAGVKDGDIRTAQDGRRLIYRGINPQTKKPYWEVAPAFMQRSTPIPVPATADNFEDLDDDED